MTTHNDIEVNVMILLPGLFSKFLGIIKTNPEIEINVFTALSLMFGMKMSGDVFKFAETLNVYNRVKEVFLDKSKRIKDYDIEYGELLIVTSLKDKDKINRLVIRRKASILDMLAMEIENGK